MTQQITAPVFADGSPVPDLLTSEEAARFFRIDTDRPAWRDAFARVRAKTGIRGAQIGRPVLFSRSELLEAFERLTETEAR